MLEKRAAKVLAASAAAAAVFAPDAVMAAGGAGSGFLERSVSLFGLLFMIGIAWLLSTDRRAIRWRIVAWGVGLQFLFGLIVLSPAVGDFFFRVVDGGVKRLLSFSEEGANFVMTATAPHHAIVPAPGDRVDTNLDPEDLAAAAEKAGLPASVTEKAVRWAIARSALDEREVRALGLPQDETVAIISHIEAANGGFAKARETLKIPAGSIEAFLAARRAKGRLSPGPWGDFDDGALKAAGFDEAESLVFKKSFFPSSPGGFYGEFVVGRISPILKTFTFWILPTIIFFSSLMTVLYHLGVMQWVVKAFAFVMQKTMGTSGAETLSASANIFVGQTEAPLVIKPYVANMTKSELNAVMVGGFATVAGGVMAAYIGFLRHIPGIAGHLVTASIMSAPAALAIAKIMVPETGEPETSGGVRVKEEKPDANVIEAAARGATEGMTLTLNVVAMLVAIVGLVALVNWVLGNTFAIGAALALAGVLCGREWLRNDSPKEARIAAAVTFVLILAALVASAAGVSLSLERILSWVFWPFAFAMGVPVAECAQVGRLLGEKIVLTEFIAYIHLGGADLSTRSTIIASYALCGFANFASIGIQIGGIGGIAPKRRGDLAKLGFRAMIGGSLAAFMTANIAGVLIP